MTGESHLHLTSIDGHKLSRELLLAIPEQGVWEGAENKWYEYPGENCLSGECEPATRSKVQILRLSYASFWPFHGRQFVGVFGNFRN
jgi:hypothetical protein